MIGNNLAALRPDVFLLTFYSVSDMTVRLNNIEEEVSGQNADIAAVVESDAEQEERLSIIEDSVDTWDDRIVVLEAADREIQTRLATLEEILEQIILSKICILKSCAISQDL